MMTFDKQVPAIQKFDKCFDGETELEIDVNFYYPGYQFPNRSYSVIIIIRNAETKENYGILMYERPITDEQEELLIAEIKSNPKKFKNQ